MTSIIMVQMMMVSTKTSKIPPKPCFTGFFVSAPGMGNGDYGTETHFIGKDTAAHAFFMLMKKLHTTPPVSREAWKALTIIEANTAGTDFIWKIITPIQHNISLSQ